MAAPQNPFPAYPALPQLPAPPPPPNFDDPAYRDAVEKQAITVAKATATFAAIAKFAPHPLIKYPALFLSGFALTEQGKLKPKPDIVMNAAPKPIGYTDPALFGLTDNFYLPNGITAQLPQFIVDKLPGGKSQQAVDTFNAMLRSQRRAELVAPKESNDTLLALAGDQFPQPLTRAALVIATSEVNRNDLRVAAQRELLRRGVPVASVPNLPPEFFASLAAAAEGSTQPASVKPTNDKALRNFLNKFGIDLDLVTERADP